MRRSLNPLAPGRVAGRRPARVAPERHGVARTARAAALGRALTPHNELEGELNLMNPGYQGFGPGWTGGRAVASMPMGTRAYELADGKRIGLAPDPRNGEDRPRVPPIVDEWTPRRQPFTTWSRAISEPRERRTASAW